MRTNVDAATAEYLQSRQSYIYRDLVYVSAKNRSSGAIENMGLWTGEDVYDFVVIDGQTGEPSATRPYYGAGSLLKVGRISNTTDLTIKTVTVGLSQINNAVKQLIRGYNTRNAPIEIHRAYFDVDTMNLISMPIPRFVGFITGNPIKTGSIGSEGGIDVKCVSNTRILTKINPAKRSDEFLKRYRMGDRLRRYTDVSKNWQIFWGEKRDNK